MADPIISEFLASNDSEQADEDGEFSDWIELHNPGTSAVSLEGWHLTDRSDNLTKWTFPNVSIPAGGHLLVFASNKDRAVSGSELHTNFKLSSDGEYLALVKPDGVSITSKFDPYPAQSTDISYGINNQQTLLSNNSPLSYLLSLPLDDAQGDSWHEHDYDDSSWVSTLSSNKTYHSQDVPQPIPRRIRSNLFINGVNGVIQNVQVNLTIEHGRTRDLRAFLIAPDGTWVELFSTVGGSSDNFINTVLSDQAETSVTAGRGPFTGTFRPEESLAQLNGKSANGRWRLELRDNFAEFSGTLRSWSLTIQTDDPTDGSADGDTVARGGIGYDTSSKYNELISTRVPTGTTELWVRYPFTVPDPAALNSLLLRLRYDDGFEAYINGVLVKAVNNVDPIQPIDSSGFVSFDLNNHLSSLRAGQNVLALKAMNTSITSSDLLLLPELLAGKAGTAFTHAFLPDPTPGSANQSGLLNPGPLVSSVTENPVPPDDGDALVIESTVQPRNSAIDAVTLRYRVNYATEVDLAMKDDDTGGDRIAADGIYSATIPASASGPGDMLRWTVIATDSDNQQSRIPLQADTTGSSRSPEYYGTVINSSPPGSLSVMQWFTADESNSRTRTGARASVFYEGRFYDNIFVRQRGGFTNNGSQKFDFNKGFPLYVNENLPAVEEINMNGNGADDSYIRQPIGFQFHNLVGNPGCEAFPVHMRLNGSFDRVGLLIEQVDKNYLERFGYDAENGELFKFVQRNDDGSNPVLSDTSSGVEKKTVDKSDLSSLQSLINDLNQSGSSSRINDFYDNMDVPEFLNYMAARCVLQMADDSRKNFYLYKDTAGDGRWRIFPWDLDFILGITGNVGATTSESPFFSTSVTPSDDGSQWNKLYDVAFEDVQMQRLYLRRIRTLMDTYLKSSPTDSWFESRINHIFNSMAGLSGPSNSDYIQLRDDEIPERRTDLHTQFTSSIPDFTTVIPSSQPANPDILIDEVDFNPTSGDQDQEYIRITNNESTEIDISGWSISDGVTFTFPPGTVVPRNGTLYVSPNLAQFVTRSTSPTAGEKRLVTGPYSGHLSSFGEDLILKNDAGDTVQTFTYAGSASDAQKYLVVSEFLYHPLSNSAAEFIELTNISPTITVNLTGVRFSEGIDFNFTDSAVTSLAPGESVLVVKDQAAFEATYGTSVSSRIAGVFSNETALNNGGENIKLEDANNATIHSFNYSSTSPWPVTLGSSLVLLNPSTRPDHDFPSNWVASPSVGGAPAGSGSLFAAWLAARGQTDPFASVNGWPELLTYALGRDLAGSSFIHASRIEIFNTNGTDTPYLTLETTIRSTADTMPIPQLATDLTDWEDADIGVDIILVSDKDNADGTRTLKWRSNTPATTATRKFIRLRVPQP